MTLHDIATHPSHGPHNAEIELRQAYNALIELNVLNLERNKIGPGLYPGKVLSLYQLAFHRYRKGNRLASERWARASKHLARAYWHEAKINYLRPRMREIPFLEGAQKGEYELQDHSDTSSDLLDSVINRIPPGFTEIPEDMKILSARAKAHLSALYLPESQHELLRAEHSQATYEYARTLECLCLAYEAEALGKTAA